MNLGSFTVTAGVIILLVPISIVLLQAQLKQN